MLAELSRHLVLRLVYQLLTQWTAPVCGIFAQECPTIVIREIKHGLVVPPWRMITKVTAEYSSREISRLSNVQ